MAAKPLVLPNGTAFAKRGEAEEHFLAMRDRYALNAPIMGNADYDDLLALLERYDESILDGPSKIGAGVSHFETRLNRTNGGTNVGFWIVRTDNSETDFSLFKAVAAKGSTEAQQFADACRATVREDILGAKRFHFETWGDAAGTVECEATGERVGPYAAKVDYVVTPFRDIVRGFRAVQGWEDGLPPGVISRPSDAQTITHFEDHVTAAAFRQYHHAAAIIRIVAKDAPGSLVRGSSSRAPARPLRL